MARAPSAVVTARVKPGFRLDVLEAARRRGMSTSAYIQRALVNQLARETHRQQQLDTTQGADGVQ